MKRSMTFLFYTTLLSAAAAACPRYDKYAVVKHEPLSEEVNRLSYARPAQECRTFTSKVVEDHVTLIKRNLKDLDLARLYENCFPNTFDTAIRFHDAKIQGKESTFVVTGDIDAMWLRDSAQQMHPYRQFISKDPSIAALFRGVINTQVEYVSQYPYCNAFQPPLAAQAAGITPKASPWSQHDVVSPPYNNHTVFECKYELDSLASFLQISVDYFEESQDPLFFADNGWLEAVSRVLELLDTESQDTIDASGEANTKLYRFQRPDMSATETLSNKGYGNSAKRVSSGVLIRSAFRPSDDATIFPFLIPSNAFMSVMLAKASDIASSLVRGREVTFEMQNLAKKIRTGVETHGIIDSPQHGKIFAYEVDGYGGTTIMDDANYPNLLGLPLMGFTSLDDPVYQNTRRMILSRNNPYFFSGREFSGVGSPHTGPGRAWPLSLLTAMQTSTDQVEVRTHLAWILNSTNGLGLMHESIAVNNATDYSRPWFSWANGVVGATIQDVLARFPGLIG